MKYILCILIGYLLGCVNFAFIIGKFKGFDIREKGSGNAGASNVTISLGWGYGVLTALLDILKGFVAVLLCRRLFPELPYAGNVSGACAVLGHIFPFYMGFKGGKGFASYMGMIRAFNWKLALAMAALTIAVTLITNYISLATLSVAIATPAYYIYKARQLIPVAILIVLLVVITYKHMINIRRILNHEEIGLRESGKHRVK